MPGTAYYCIVVVPEARAGRLSAVKEGTLLYFADHRELSSVKILRRAIPIDGMIKNGCGIQNVRKLSLGVHTMFFTRPQPTRTETTDVSVLDGKRRPWRIRRAGVRTVQAVIPRIARTGRTCQATLVAIAARVALLAVRYFS